MNREEYIKSCQEGKKSPLRPFLSVSLLQKDYDKLKKAAKELGVTVSAYVRSILFYEE